MELAQFFKVPLNEDRFFLEAHVKLRPVDFPTEGVFVCGLAHSPKLIEESITQAKAAASRAAAILSKARLKRGGQSAWLTRESARGAVCASSSVRSMPSTWMRRKILP